MKLPGQTDMTKVAVLTAALYGSIHLGYAVIGFPIPDSWSSLVLMPLNVGGPHPLWLLNPYGLFLVAVAIVCYSVGVVLWLRGRSGRAIRTMPMTLTAALATLLIGLLFWDQLRMAMRPRGYEVPLGERLLDLLSRGPLAMRFLVAAVVQAVSTPVIVSLTRSPDMGRQSAVDHP